MKTVLSDRFADTLSGGLWKSQLKKSGRLCLTLAILQAPSRRDAHYSTGYAIMVLPEKLWAGKLKKIRQPPIGGRTILS